METTESQHQAENGSDSKLTQEGQAYPVFVEGTGDAEALYMPEKDINYEITGLTQTDFGIKCVIALYHKGHIVNKNLLIAANLILQ